MAVQQNLPSNVRRPVAAHTFDFTSGARGLRSLSRRLAIVAMKTAAGTASADVPVQITSEADARTLLGVGSEAALGVSSALKNFRRTARQHAGGAAEVWVVPVTDPGGTAAVHRFVIAGTATASGDLIIRIAGRTIRASVNNGDAAATVAATLNGAINAIANDLPGTSGVATVNVDFTVTNTGVFGNDVVTSVESEPAGITATPSALTPGVGSAVLTTPLASLLDKLYLAIAIGNHASADVTALQVHTLSAWDSTTKLFTHGFVAEGGTLATATALAAAANDETIQITTAEDSPNLPIEISCAVAAMGVTVERPAFNYNRTELDLFAPPAASVYNSTEIETALAAGTTPLSVTDNGNVLMERLVTTKTTESSSPFEDLLDLKNSKTLAFYALQIDAAAQQAMKGSNLDQDFIDLVEDIVFSILVEGENIGDLHNVELHKTDLLLEVHPTIASRLLIEVPQAVVPSATQLDFTHRLFVEAPGDA